MTIAFERGMRLDRRELISEILKLKTPAKQ